MSGRRCWRSIRAWDGSGQALYNGGGLIFDDPELVVDRRVVRRLEAKGLAWLEPSEMWWCGLSHAGHELAETLIGGSTNG